MTKARMLSSTAVPPEGEDGPDLSTLPVRVDRRTGAELVTRLFFPVSHRTLEAWPLTLRRVNGRATIATAELFALARAKLDAAPEVRGGRKPKVPSHAAAPAA